MRISSLAVLALVGCGGSPPSVGSVEITPDAPRTDEPLTATATDVADKNGDDVTLTWSWTVNGSPVDGDGDTLRASAFVKGDQVVATVVPSDEDGEGEPVSSRAVTVLNTPPLVISASLDPEDPSSTDTIGVEVFTRDPDDDPVTLRYAWTVDGVPAGSDSTLPPIHPRGSVIGLRVTPDDGESVGEQFELDPVTTLNGAPPAPLAPALNADDAWVPSPLTCTADPVLDPDGDDVNYVVEFAVDGTPGDRVSSLDGVATVSRLGTARGGEWTCRARARDSEGESSDWSPWSDPISQDCEEYEVTLNAFRTASFAYSSTVWWEDDTLRAYEYPGAGNTDVVALLAFDLDALGAIKGIKEASLVVDVISDAGAPKIVLVQFADDDWYAKTPHPGLERTGEISAPRSDFTPGDQARIDIRMDEWTDGPSAERRYVTVGIDNLADDYSYVYFKSLTNPSTDDPYLSLTVCR